MRTIEESVNIMHRSISSVYVEVVYVSTHTDQAESWAVARAVLSPFAIELLIPT